jgi:acyl-CoA thioester hydrolase
MWPQLAGEIRQGRHIMPVRVYYEDTDCSGVVYHASYVRFMERGRTEYLRLIGANQRDLLAAAAHLRGGGFMVRAMTIEFFRPAQMDDVLEITTQPTEVKGASVRLDQGVRRGEDVLVSAHVRVAFVAGGRARPMPKPLRAALLADCERAALGSSQPSR